MDHKVPGVGQHGLVEAGYVTHQVVETVSRDSAGGIHVHPVEGLHNLSVIRNFKVWYHRLAKTFNLYIGRVVRADGDGRVNDIRNNQHNFPDFFCKFGFLLFQFCQPVGISLYFGFGFLCFGQLRGVFFGLTHEHPHLFGQGVPGGTQFVGFGHSGSILCVQG